MECFDLWSVASRRCCWLSSGVFPCPGRNDRRLIQWLAGLHLGELSPQQTLGHPQKRKVNIRHTSYLWITVSKHNDDLPCSLPGAVSRITEFFVGKTNRFRSSGGATMLFHSKQFSEIFYGHYKGAGQTLSNHLWTRAYQDGKAQWLFLVHCNRS